MPHGWLSMALYTLPLSPNDHPTKAQGSLAVVGDRKLEFFSQPLQAWKQLNPHHWPHRGGVGGPGILEIAREIPAID